MFSIQSVAGFYLDGSDAFGDQRIEPGQAFGDELIVAGCADGADCGADAAAGAGDFLLACSGEALLELMRPAACPDEMGVAVDQAGEQPAAFAIDDFMPV